MWKTKTGRCFSTCRFLVSDLRAVAGVPAKSPNLFLDAHLVVQAEDPSPLPPFPAERGEFNGAVFRGLRPEKPRPNKFPAPGAGLGVGASGAKLLW